MCSKILKFQYMCIHVFFLSSIHRYMVEKYPFIDETRIAASGVSYGGYVVGMMLAGSKEDGIAPIHCGVAISPVVEWRYYGI